MEDVSSFIHGYCTYDFIDRTYGFFMKNIFPWLNLTFYSLIPNFIMIICNIFIIQSVVKSARRRRIMTSSHQRAESNTRQTSITLIIVCLVALVTTSPFTILTLLTYGNFVPELIASHSDLYLHLFSGFTIIAYC